MNKKKVLTCAGGGGSLLSGKSHVTDSRPAKCGTGSAGGFTMAEILLSLTIIGVVAAITLPSLTGNINERTWNTQRKALYARFSQAISLMPAMNGYGSTAENAAETFVTAGLSKVLKINNICDNEHLADCGISSKIIPANGDPVELNSLSTLWEMTSFLSAPDTRISVINSKAVAFETVNGESVLAYYNPNCVSLDQSYNDGTNFYSNRLMCANFIYDLNGSKGPNTAGKDIGFLTVFYPVDSVVVTANPGLSFAGSGSQDSVMSFCTKKASDLRLPNLEELLAMIFNNKIIGMQHYNTGYYWSSTATHNGDPLSKWVVTLGGRMIHSIRGITWEPVWCVKR